MPQNSSQAWRTLTAQERALVFSVVIYLSIVALFLIFWTHLDLAKNIVTILGLMLAAAIPELASKRRIGFRVALILAPVIGTALVQVANDRSSSLTIGLLSRQLEDLQVRKTKNQAILDRERLEEEVELDPIDTIKAVRNADRGFLIKADRLSVLVAAREAAFLAAWPLTAPKILSFPDPPAARLHSYCDWLSEHGGVLEDRGARQAVTGLIRALEEEVGYLQAADFFAREVKPRYAKLLPQAEGGALDSIATCKQLGSIRDTLAPLAEATSIAGLYSHLGGLAMACELHDNALAYYYRGIAIDPEHIPIYESLAYALWIINKDTEGALKYATHGLEVSLREKGALSAELRDANRDYETAARAAPKASSAIRRRAAALNAHFAVVDKEWNDFVTGITAHLTLDYAYFSALRIDNETRARKLMSDLLASVMSLK